MARVFITGSSTGLGLLAGQHLMSNGHDVVLHARNEMRAREARAALPGVADVVVGNLETMDGAAAVAAQANALGRFDAVIHNAGDRLWQRRPAPDDGWLSCDLRRQCHGSLYSHGPYHAA